MKKAISFLTKPQLLQRVWKKFHFEQWTLMLTRREDDSQPAWSDFKALVPPRDKFWADPFPWQRDGQSYIFYEELPFATKRGHISCITLNENLEIVSNQVVLQRPYHLSYPYLFEYEGELYMIPESFESNAIELYHCTRFPDQWEFKKVLINIRAVDATLLEANGKWWMFANVIEAGGNSHDTLHLFSASNPLTDEWTPHPCNPIVKDIKNARPAGRIIVKDGELIRPSQDCSQRYGYAINFNRITKLTGDEYAETLVSTILPPQNDKKAIATHTWNKAGNLIASDVQYLRRKF